jgi:hypothetical protein
VARRGLGRPVSRLWPLDFLAREVDAASLFAERPAEAAEGSGLFQAALAATSKPGRLMHAVNGSVDRQGAIGGGMYRATLALRRVRASTSRSTRPLGRVAPVKIPRTPVDDAYLRTLGPAGGAAQPLGNAADKEGFGEGSPVQPRLVVAGGAEHPNPELLGRRVIAARLCCLAEVIPEQ